MSRLDAGVGLSQNGLALKALSAVAKVTVGRPLLHSNNSLRLNKLSLQATGRLSFGGIQVGQNLHSLF